MINGMIAIVGRPNVGKSTLFNRLTRSQTSIIDDQPGVTRDRIYGTAYYDHTRKDGFMVVDTGGFETDDFKFQPFAENIVWSQTEHAIHESDIVLFLMDGKHGVHQHDRDLVQYLKQTGKTILYAVNKVDGQEKESLIWDFYSLGLDKIWSVSAAHSKGIADLLECIKEALQDHCVKAKQYADSLVGTKIALVGRPNAGKSSILNKIIGTERSLVSSVAGTTRDSLDTCFNYHNKPYVLIDTAGIRRKTKINENLEVQSVVRSLRAIDRSDVVLFVIDALEGITDQDARLINLSISRGKPVLIVVNKWDLVPDKTSNTSRDYTDNIQKRILKDIGFVPIHFVSCLHNQRVQQIMEKVTQIIEQCQKKISTSKVNDSLQNMVARHSPHLIKKVSKRVKFYYATQVSHRPPTFVVMCNMAQDIHSAYKRYMIKSFRKDLGLADVPVRLIFRGKKEVKNRKENPVALPKVVQQKIMENKQSR